MASTSTILCVDDDEDDLLFIREAVYGQAHPFEVAEAHNGWEALHYLNQSIASGSLPCLIILDMNMPRMDGMQTVQKIRELPELDGVRIVMFTTSSNQSHRAWFEDKGVEFISKPFDYQDFKTQILAILADCAGSNG